MASEEIILPNGAKFSIRYGKVYFKNKLFFAHEPVTTLPSGVNVEKLAMLMLKDKKLLQLTNEYFEYANERNQIQVKKEELVNKLTEMIEDSKTYTYAQLSSRLGCVEVKKNTFYGGADYVTKHFSLKVEIPNGEFSCIVQDMDRAIREVYPEMHVRITQSDKTISILVNNTLVYVTTKIQIRKVLSFLFYITQKGNVIQFLNTLVKLYNLYLKEGEDTGMDLKIAQRINQLAEMSVE